MMVNTKLMLVVVMLWTGSLPLVSPRHQPKMMRKFWGKSVCDKYELPEKAAWIPRTSCGENKKFSCQRGYQLQIQTTCNKIGKWYLEPSCQDIDECKTNNGLCEFMCHNEPGSYNCSCPEGSKLTENGLNCEATIVPCRFENETKLKMFISFYGIYQGLENEVQCESRCNRTDGCTDFLRNSGCRLYGSPTLSVDKRADMTIPKCQSLCIQNRQCVTGQFNGQFCVLYSSKLSELDLEDDDEEDWFVFYKIDMNCF